MLAKLTNRNHDVTSYLREVGMKVTRDGVGSGRGYGAAEIE